MNTTATACALVLTQSSRHKQTKYGTFAWNTLIGELCHAGRLYDPANPLDRIAFNDAMARTMIDKRYNPEGRRNRLRVRFYDLEFLPAADIAVPTDPAPDDTLTLDADEPDTVTFAENAPEPDKDPFALGEPEPVTQPVVESDPEPEPETLDPDEDTQPVDPPDPEPEAKAKPAPPKKKRQRR